MYMKDWIARLDAIINLNGRELLHHAGTISHEMALEKSDAEYEKYKEAQKLLEHEASLRELDDDLKHLNEPRPPGKTD